MEKSEAQQILIEKYSKAEITSQEFIDGIEKTLHTSHPTTLPSDEEIYKVEARRMPIGDTGDYDSWLELITPNFNLSCYDSNVEFEEIKKLADKLNFATIASAKLAEILNEVKRLRFMIDNGLGVKDIQNDI